MTMHEDPTTVLDNAIGAVRGAAVTVKSTTESIADAIEDNRRPGGVLDQVARTTREAPLRALALAFVVGWIVARQR
jgi:hypothetical protein